MGAFCRMWPSPRELATTRSGLRSDAVFSVQVGFALSTDRLDMLGDVLGMGLEKVSSRTRDVEVQVIL